MFCVFVSQSHTYVNLTDFDLTPESMSHSGVASVTNDSSLSQSKADSLSSQMATLSKCSRLHPYLYHTMHAAHVQCMYASTYSMHCKLVAVLVAGTSESDDTLAQKIIVSTQQRQRYRKTINHSCITSKTCTVNKDCIILGNH